MNTKKNIGHNWIVIFDQPILMENKTILYNISRTIVSTFTKNMTV